MPDRALVTMTTHCMQSYSLLAIKTCHRRGIHAIGGMAAQIPIKNDPQANERRWRRFAPTRCARPATVTTARGWPTRPGGRRPKRLSTPRMPEPNQIGRHRDDVQVTAKDLLPCPRAKSPSAACARTSTWASNTWRPGWRATAACPFTTSWRTRPPPKSRRSQIWQWVHQPNGVLDRRPKGHAGIGPHALRRRKWRRSKQTVGHERFAHGNYRPGAEAHRADRAGGRVYRIHDARGIRAFAND